jgi:DNA-binding MarR family transcriptional regulator
MTTQRELVLKTLKFDIEYHLTEISDICNIKYFSASRVMDELVSEGIFEKIPTRSGIYVRYSRKGRVRAHIKQLIAEVEHLNKTLYRLKASRDEKIKEINQLKDQYEKMKQEE